MREIGLTKRHLQMLRVQRGLSQIALAQMQRFRQHFERIDDCRRRRREFFSVNCIHKHRFAFLIYAIKSNT
jgi:hypothetical protein